MLKKPVVVRLLDDPSLIENELTRRQEAARHADSTERHLEALNQEEIHLRNSMERLRTAFDYFSAISGRTLIYGGIWNSKMILSHQIPISELCQ